MRAGAGTPLNTKGSMKRFALVALLTLCTGGAAYADFQYSFELETGDTFFFYRSQHPKRND